MSKASHESGRAASIRAGRLGLTLLITVIALGSATQNAGANTYTGLLYGGTLSIGSNTASESGGYVYGADSWSVPSGTEFDGFAYTSATFSSLSDNSIGGVSAGFGAGGTANQPVILFPWTRDCSITNRGHYWTRSGALAGTSGVQACNTNGNTSGWNYTNVEIDNTDPSVNPNVGYQTLWLTVFCQAATCAYDPGREWGAAGASVTNLSASVVDSYNQPFGSAAWTSAVSGASWYQTDGSSISVNLGADDPAGVCDLYAFMTGPSEVVSPLLGHQSPGIVYVGAPIGSEFANGINPCWAGQSDTGTWTLPGDVPSGSYSLNVAAANPGNYEAQGFSPAYSPTVASYVDAINIDDTVPTARWSVPPLEWTSAASELLDVTTGPSGLSAVTCTDNGVNVEAHLVSGATSGAGTTVWSVATTASGTNAVACSMSNGDTNGALTGHVSGVFGVDQVVPTVTFEAVGYSAGGWTNKPVSVTVQATGGPSGIASVSCSVDGGPEQQLGSASGGLVNIGADGRHVLSCTALSGTAVRGTATFNVNIDARQPTVTYVVDGAPVSSDWLSGTPVVSVIASEQGGILSGIEGISCSVNGGGAFALTGIAPGSNYTGSFELDQNGADHVSCTATTVAGTVQATPTTATVNVDNPNFSATPSALIDNGGDPYSNGPSQSQWYVTPQTVTITANNTGGAAPIAAIACKGALSGTWPISNLNADGARGEQITVTVPPPGGVLSCTAQDTAGNVYVLGSYIFQIDSTAPTGYFVPKTDWPAPDEIAVHASDNGGSGVALVKVYGESPDVNQGQPQLVGNAQYDAANGDYVVTVPDGVDPWVPGSWRFYANVVDVAGNQGQVTAGPDGSTEDLTLPLREDTAVSATAQAIAAAPEPAIPTGLAAAALPGSAAVARVEVRSRAWRPRAHAASVGRAAGLKPGRAVLRVRYGERVTITGMLMDMTHHRTPISGARILIYQRLSGARAYTRLGEARTNPAGLYRYRVRPGASRTLYVVYPGNALLRPAASQLQEQSEGSMSLRASSIQAGGRLVIDGYVRGGAVPRGGLDVTIDYRQLGAPGSGTLGTVRTTRNGHFRFSQRFSRGTRGLEYQLWAVVPGGQAGWPYLGAHTSRVIRRVH